MKFKYLGEQQKFKTSTNTGLFYEFEPECEVENKDDIEFFSNHPKYELAEKKKVKKGDD